MMQAERELIKVGAMATLQNMIDGKPVSETDLGVLRLNEELGKKEALA